VNTFHGRKPSLVNARHWVHVLCSLASRDFALPSRLGHESRPRHVIGRAAIKWNLTESTSPLPTSINTSPQHGCASTTHDLLDVHRLAICTTQELSLQPAWTSPKVVRHCQLHAKRSRRTKRGSAPCGTITSMIRATSSISHDIFLGNLVLLLCWSDAT
jgi:hypothetical protein